MEITVYATLREIVGGKSIQIDDIPEMTVEQTLQEIIAIHPALRSEILDETGLFRPSFHIVVNGRNVRFLDGLETVVSPEDTIHIFPPIGVGCQ